MRWAIGLIAGSLAVGACRGAWAHGDAESLGHHWDSPIYMAELRFQLVLMAGAGVAMAGWLLLLARKRRRDSQ